MQLLDKKNAIDCYRLKRNKLPGYLSFLMLFFLVLSIHFSSIAQNSKTVRGRVTDEKNAPISGASVTVKGSTKGTVTNSDGYYIIQAPTNGVLNISFVGYETKQAPVGAGETVNISLAPSNESLNQVVVVGYGTQRKASITGAIASVNSKTINELPVVSVDQALQGRVAGLSVVNNGAPGTQPIVAIRGISSISFASDPLYVIDGFPTGNISSFDSRDIESVEVLKDASAAAIYGSRATNGVIIITTKKGARDSKLHVNLDTYIGMQSPGKKLDLLNTNQYKTYERMINGSAGIAMPPRFLDSNFNKPIYAGANQTYAQTNTDWQDEYFVNNALMTQTNVSVSGGNSASRFYSSGGYLKQDGIAQGLGYERGNFRINSEHTISKVFTFGENLYMAFGNQRFDNNATATSGNRTRLMNVVRMQPYLPVYDPTTLGGFRGPLNSFDGADPTNPVELALIGSNTIKTLKVLGTAYLDVNFTSWLKFRSTFGVDYSNAYTQQYTPIYNDGGTLSASLATINNQRQIYSTLLFTEQLTFDKTWNQHHLNVTGVFERQGQKYWNETATGNQGTNEIRTLNGASNINANATYQENLIVSLLGRLNYDYAGKYFVSAAIRRDGLSIWAPGHKYGNFPSASVGWRISQEQFMKSSKLISELKLRAGYGLTGLNGLLLNNNYPWFAAVQTNQAIYPFGDGTSPNSSFTNTLGNKDLEWEKTKQYNVGIDLGLLNNKITLTADYFVRQTDNLIYQLPTPPTYGFGVNGVLSNVASMRNNGFEAQLGYHHNQSAFKWEVSGLVTVIRNKVLSMNTPTASLTAGGDADFGGGDPWTYTTVGQPIQQFYGWKTAGIFQTAAEVSSSPTQVAGKTAPGDIKFQNINTKDNVINSDDKTYLGSFLPKFTYSFNGNASYKNFDFSILFQGVQGNKIVNGVRIIEEGMVRLFGSGTRVLDSWTPNHTNTDMPRAFSGDPNQNARPSDRWIEDGSFLRLKNVMIGYNVPVTRLNSLTRGTVSRFRIYVSSQNLFTVTKYKGWDPEIGSKNGTLTNGIDYGQYPIARSFQVGLQVGFN
ncbi:SusC/RagA family TonB-linked outer membrane protein [Pinibacter aurantiacus]|uniref:TonB-dependent receptor n=1 Tax=Pinibacter aurantiacus TaxID=2851599 RepID=A0A9E2S4Q9_9BACT|nr:TonB-dependent receptor [Pinibacter aurantiacus]MBV4355691.1 TonB-dependent receptor [Pinibacter aurantiacus]